MEEKKRDLVFLSYAHDELNRIRKVYKGIRKREVAIWFYKAVLFPSGWYLQIMKKNAQRRYLILCLSNTALKKRGMTNQFSDQQLQHANEIDMRRKNTVFKNDLVRLENYIGVTKNKLR